MMANQESDFPTSKKKGPQPDVHPALVHVEEALRGLRFGQVIVTVQDGVAVQIERAEKRRLV